MKEITNKIGVIYYFNKPKTVIKEDYEPMDFKSWKLYREIEPSKFGLNYRDYIRLKEEQFLTDVERNKKVSMELNSLMYSLYDSEITETINLINSTQNDENFIKWVDNNIVNKILIDYSDEKKYR